MGWLSRTSNLTKNLNFTTRLYRLKHNLTLFAYTKRSTLLLFQVHEYLRSKLCSLYENDCIFDKFECCWNGNDTAIMTGSYNNFFRMFDRNSRYVDTFYSVKPKYDVLTKRKSFLSASTHLFDKKIIWYLPWAQFRHGTTLVTNNLNPVQRGDLYNRQFGDRSKRYSLET